MLDLRFQRLHGKTTLTTRHHVGPLTVQRPFYPEEETCHLCLLHPPGGIVGGDELIINAIIGSDCHTLITMPGASKFYRSSGAQAHLQQNLTLCNNATLEWLPQDSIFSRRSRHVAYRVSSVVLQYTAGLGSSVPWASGHRRSLQPRNTR